MRQTPTPSDGGPPARRLQPGLLLAERHQTPVRPVRFTVVLEPDSHDSLRRFAVAAHTAASDVVRALLQELFSSEDLARRVLERLRRAGGDETG